MSKNIKDGPITVMIANFGQMAVFQNGEQRADLQKPWILMIADYFKEKGVDPTKVDFKITDGHKIEIFDTLEGYSWRVK